MDTSFFSLRRLLYGWEKFFFSEIDPKVFSYLRIGYGILLLINLLVLWPDLEYWFSNSGVLPLEASQKIVDPDVWTLFQWLPQGASVVWFCYGIFILQTVAFLFGIFPRFQAIGLFLWWITFEHRNIIIFDAEDNLFRLFAFFFIWAKSDAYYSVMHYFKKSAEKRAIEKVSIWPLRLFQIQMTIVYVSSVLHKLDGADWLSGNALYYVSRLDDLFGNYPWPVSDS